MHCEKSYISNENIILKFETKSSWAFFFFHCKNLKKSENFNNAIFVEYILTDFSSLKSKRRKFKLFSQVRDWLHLTNIVMTRLCIFISYKSYFNCYISSRLLPISPPPLPMLNRYPTKQPLSRCRDCIRRHPGGRLTA